jgi:ABC-type dipeptide/oligopeptide/nickel transport system permease component
MGFRRFVVYRFVTMIGVILILLTFIFFAVHILPGDPVDAMVGPGASQQFIDAVRARLGLDKPLIFQYFDYVTGVFTGNLGQSIVLGESVNSLILARAGVTLQLSVLSWVVSSGLGVILGKFSALKAGKVQDHGLRAMSLFFYAIPVYVLGIICQIVFGLWLGILPVFGTKSPTVNPPTVTGMILVDTLLAGDLWGFLNAASHFILPVLCLSAYYMAVTIRLTRSETVKAMRRTFCLLAQAKGLSLKQIVDKHAYRNAVLPVVTLIALQAGSLLTGSILIEEVFSLKGLGDLLYVAASARDFILLQGVITAFVLITSIIGMIIDISYYYLDPRVRY